MRLDKYLKVSRLIKRRTVANEACDNARISVNGKPAKASYDVKVGDQIEIAFGARTLRVEVLAVAEAVRKDDASAEVRVERREMVVCNLRVRVGRNGQQRRFSDVRESNQTHVRQKLELQNHLMLFARKTGFCKTRHLPGRRCKVLVAPAAAARNRAGGGYV